MNHTAFPGNLVARLARFVGFGTGGDTSPPVHGEDQVATAALNHWRRVAIDLTTSHIARHQPVVVIADGAKPVCPVENLETHPLSIGGLANIERLISRHEVEHASLHRS